MTTGDQTFAAKRIDVLLSARGAARNPDDPKWRQLWAGACVATGQLCVETRQNERGVWFQIDARAIGWRMWAAAH
jgi:hypothetical protein